MAHQIVVSAGTLFLATSNVSSFDITLTNISDSYIAIMDSVLYNAYLPINDSLLLMRDVLKYFHVRGVIAINMDIRMSLSSLKRFEVR